MHGKLRRRKYGQQLNRGLFARENCSFHVPSIPLHETNAHAVGLCGGGDKTCVIYDDDLEALRLLAARAAPRLTTAAPLPPALPPQEYVPRSREPLPELWAYIMEESDGRR